MLPPVWSADGRKSGGKKDELANPVSVTRPGFLLRFFEKTRGNGGKQEEKREKISGKNGVSMRFFCDRKRKVEKV